LAKQELKFYSLEPIKSKGCCYNIIFGERSNGKSYASKLECLDSVKKGKAFAIIRRELEDFKYKRAEAYFSDVEMDGKIEAMHIKVPNDPEGRYYNGIAYRTMRYYLCFYDYENDKKILSQEPVGYCFALSSFVHDKSTSYPNISTIIFEEFIARTSYYTDEFVIFQNVLSTIIRQRDDVVIYMLGNTVNAYCPYFDEMGLKHIKKMKKNTIDIYEYGNSGLRVAVEYADSISKKGKPSDKYFAFDNPKLKMITGGDWEIDIYPHIPERYLPKDVLFTFFIEFKEEKLKCDIVHTGNDIWVYVQQKTTPIKYPEKDIVFSTLENKSRTYNRNLLKPTSKIHKRIRELCNSDNTFYQSNEVGEIMRNYLLWCRDNA